MVELPPVTEALKDVGDLQQYVKTALGARLRHGFGIYLRTGHVDFLRSIGVTVVVTIDNVDL